MTRTERGLQNGKRGWLVVGCSVVTMDLEIWKNPFIRWVETGR